MPLTVQLTADAPGLAQQAAGTIIAQHQDGSLVSEDAPVSPGEYVVAYLAGLGPANQTVLSGTAAPSDNLANVLDTPVLTLNGSAVPNVAYAGLTPTLVGLYQINFRVPESAPGGDLLLVVIQSSGVSSSAVLPVRQ